MPARSRRPAAVMPPPMSTGGWSGRDRCPTATRDDAARSRCTPQTSASTTSFTVSSRKNAAVNDGGDERRPARARASAGGIAAAPSIGLVTIVSRPPVGASGQVVAARLDLLGEVRLVPQRLAARDQRDAARRVVAGRQPFQRAGVPDVARRCPQPRPEVARDVDEEQQRRRRASMKAPIVETRFSPSQPRPAG